MPLIETVLIDQTSFTSALSSWEDFTEVYGDANQGAGKIIEAPMCERVANRHASSCLIVWAFNLRERKLLSGHFPATDLRAHEQWKREHVMRKLSEEAQVPTTSIRSYSPQDCWPLRLHDPDIELYENFLGHLQQLMQSCSQAEMEVHVFGHNYQFWGDNPADIPRHTRTLLERWDVVANLRHAGVASANLYDHRQQGLRATHTLFSPRDQSLFYFLEK